MTMTLSDVCREIDKETLNWSSPDGSITTLLPYGGRILGLSSPASTENFFWTHPALQSTKTAHVFYRTPMWHNSGGDRTWLAPEAEFFYPHYPDCSVYLQPPQLDSTTYEVELASEHVSMVNRFTIPMYASKSKVELTLTKKVSQTNNPLLEASPKLASAVQFAGYTLTTTLDLHKASPDSPPIGLWNLVQLPYGGEAIIPTRSRAIPVVHMGPIAHSDLKVTEHLTRYRMVAPGEHKFGLPPAFPTGSIGYISSAKDLLSLIVRSFAVNPSGTYVDFPLNGNRQQASAVQLCNINSRLGKFAELEHHAPAIGGTTPDSRRVDESRLWAFRGSYSNIMEVARLLVSSEV